MTDARVSAESAFDVIILSSGFSSCLLGTILAANGLKVAILEQKSHPIFAIGESTVPRTSVMMKIIAQRYGVEEIARVTNFPLRGHTTNGVKRNFGFIYHQPGQSPEPNQVIQTLIPEFPHGSESHLFRQDSDASQMYAAIRRGAVVHQNIRIDDVDLSDRGATVETSEGSFTARYLVDGCGGPRSILAQKLGLRADVEHRTASRSLYTHMIDVTAFEALSEQVPTARVPRPWSQGTLHHIFDGGWVWVIPFNNHERSINPVCSVGLTLDIRKHGDPEGTPAEEFATICARYPGIGAQFANAKPVREWTGTGRLQYSSMACATGRYCISSHGAGFIDPLFSRGLANTSTFTNLLVRRILNACENDTFRDEDFGDINILQDELIDVNDRLVACSYIAWRDYRLWQAWSRIWVLGWFLDYVTLSALLDGITRGVMGEQALVGLLDGQRHRNTLCPLVPAYAELFDAAACAIEAVAAGSSGSGDAATHIMDLLRSSSIVPPLLDLTADHRIHDPELTLSDHFKLLDWAASLVPLGAVA